MSIALSVVVRPSRLLDLLCAGMLLAAAAGFMAVIAGFVGEWELARRALLAAAALVFFGAAWRAFAAGRTTPTLDISANGQLRLAEHRACGERRAPERLRLLPDSTLWPGLLVLRLARLPDAGQPGQPSLPDRRKAPPALAILPDSVGPEAFRRLAVACRWLAAHNAPDSRTGG